MRITERMKGNQKISIWTELNYNSPATTQSTQRKLGSKVTCLLQAGTV